MNTRFLFLKSFYIRLFLLAATLSVVVSCQRDEQELITATTSTIDLSDGETTAGGKIWKETFTPQKPLEIGIFKFNHNASSSVYNGITYRSWSGFTISNSNDNADHQKSEGSWVTNQWGTMPQGGVDGKGTPFLVSYTDINPAKGIIKNGEITDISQFKSSVEITDDSLYYTARSVSVAMSPWAYYGIKNGDSFARKFVKGDYFALHIYGFDREKKPTHNAEPITHYFVDFRNGESNIDTTWKNINLSPLGNVKYLVFFLETTDVGQWGGNTAAYFTMDKLKVEAL